MPSTLLHPRGWKGDINTTLPADWSANLRRYYYAAVTHTDEMVGRVLGTIKQLGIENNTIVAFWVSGAHARQIYAGY